MSCSRCVWFVDWAIICVLFGFCVSLVGVSPCLACGSKLSLPSHIGVPGARGFELRIVVLGVSSCAQNRRRKQYTRIFPSRFGACSGQGKQTILNATRQYPSIRPGASTYCCVNRETKPKEKEKERV